MFFKLLISATIIVSSTLIGCECAKRHVLRHKQLRELQGALSRLETEITHYTTRLPEALIIIGDSIKGEIGKLLNYTGEILNEKNGVTIAKAWRATLNKLKESLYLNKDEIEILYRFGDQLGSSDKEGQSKYIKLTIDQLYHQELNARETREKYERMYKSLGLLGGIAIAVLLM